MEIRVNRIGRMYRLGTGAAVGGGGGPPPPPDPPGGIAIVSIRAEILSPILGDAMEVVSSSFHGFIPADVGVLQITISGNTVPAYNATWTLYAIKNATIFAIQTADSGTGTGGTWTR